MTGNIKRCMRKRDLLNAFAADLLIFHGLMRQKRKAKAVQPVTLSPSRIQHIRQTHRILYRGHLNATIIWLAENMHIIFQIVTDFQNRFIFTERTKERHSLIKRNLFRSVWP